MVTREAAKRAANRIIALILREEATIDPGKLLQTEQAIRDKMDVVCEYCRENNPRQDIRNFEEVAMAHPIEFLHDLGLVNPSDIRVKRVFTVHLLFDHLGEMPGTNLFIKGIQHLPFAEKEKILKRVFGRGKNCLYEILVSQSDLTALRARFHQLSEKTPECPEGAIRTYLKHLGGNGELLSELLSLPPGMRRQVDAKRTVLPSKEPPPKARAIRPK